jgi:hypothetical protein
MYYVLEAMMEEGGEWTTIYNGTDDQYSMRTSSDTFHSYYQLTAFYRDRNATSDLLFPFSMLFGEREGGEGVKYIYIERATTDVDSYPVFMEFDDQGTLTFFPLPSLSFPSASFLDPLFISSIYLIRCLPRCVQFFWHDPYTTSISKWNTAVLQLNGKLHAHRF